MRGVDTCFLGYIGHSCWGSAEQYAECWGCLGCEGDLLPRSLYGDGIVTLVDVRGKLGHAHHVGEVPEDRQVGDVPWSWTLLFPGGEELRGRVSLE